MQPDTVLTLGDFEFSQFEIPENIAFGGDQRLVVHELVGGTRVIDAMGRSNMPLEWSGLFKGPNALERARYLDNLRVGGKAWRLSWDELAFDVVIASFKANYERYYQVPYHISCLVLQDASNPVNTIADPGIDALIVEDMAGCNDLGGIIGDGPLSDLLAGLDKAIAEVSSFANAVQSTINSVLIPLAAVQARVRILIGAVGNTVMNVTTLGGVLPNNPIAQQAGTLLGQVNAMTQLPALYNLQSVLGRMGGNLGTIWAGRSTVTIGSGNLFDLAVLNYNDPTAWTTLAKANGLNDPQLSGINTLTVPVQPDGSGGVLHA